MANRTRSLIWKAAVLLAAIMAVGACSGGKPNEPTITLTFVRHAESEANADGVINTDVPGPGLTKIGEGQAQQVAHQLGRNHYDGVWASTMIRTKQTADPLAQQLGKQVRPLPGLNEISAGWFDGKPQSMASSTYLLAPQDWLKGDVDDAIPGSTAVDGRPLSGRAFDDQFSGAVQKIYESHQKNPVAFSHGNAIMYWTLMNVTNGNDNLVNQRPLPNIGRVVIKGSPANGWTLVEWDGLRDFSY